MSETPAPKNIDPDLASEATDPIPSPVEPEASSPKAGEEKAQPSAVVKEPVATADSQPHGIDSKSAAEEREPGGEKENKPVEKAPEPAEEKAESLEKEAKPADKASKSEEKESKPAENEAKLVEKASEPAEKKAESSEKEAKPADKASNSVEKIPNTAENEAKPIKKASETAEKKAESSEKEIKPAEKVSKSDEKESKPAEKAAQSTDDSAKPAEKAAKPAPKPKPQKPEDKPFPEFIDTLFLPAVVEQLKSNDITAERLERVDGDRPVVGGSCPMVIGELPGGRRFWLCFAKADINSQKVIALADPGSEPTLLESFLIDEKRTSLALLVSRLLQRLNGQKWLGGN